MSQEPLDPELEAVETALGRLAPARSRLDRDRLMFQAGAMSVRAGSHRPWVWPSIAAALSAVIVSESIALATRPDPRVVIVMQEPGPPRGLTEPGTVRILVGGEPATTGGEVARAVGGGEAVGLRRQ